MKVLCNVGRPARENKYMQGKIKTECSDRKTKYEMVKRLNKTKRRQEKKARGTQETVKEKAMKIHLL